LEFSGAVEQFISIRSTKIICSPLISIDETMRAMVTGDNSIRELPNISFIVRNPEPLGKNKKFFYSL
jgi:hypothetical protein